MSFRPASYHRHRWACELDFRLSMVKLLDWKDSWSKLETSDNVFSLVDMNQIVRLFTTPRGRAFPTMTFSGSPAWISPPYTKYVTMNQWISHRVC